MLKLIYNLKANGEAIHKSLCTINISLCDKRQKGHRHDLTHNIWCLVQNRGHYMIVTNWAQTQKMKKIFELLEKRLKRSTFHVNCI